MTFGFGTVATAPPNTQTNIGFSGACRVGLTAATATIGNTACIVFNSRGLPVDGAGAAVRGPCHLSDRRQGCGGHDSDSDAAHPALVDAGAPRNGRVERTTVTATTLDVNRPADGQRGFSLVETMVALCLLLVVTAGVLPLAVLTFRISENHGHLLARATEYAQDKLEQLMSLSYGDVVTDTRVFPAVTTGGTGLTPGGSANTAAPVDGYVDYLTLEGALLATVVGGGAPADWYYQRVWRVEELGAADPARCPVSGLCGAEVPEAHYRHDHRAHGRAGRRRHHPAVDGDRAQDVSVLRINSDHDHDTAARTA